MTTRLSTAAPGDLAQNIIVPGHELKEVSDFDILQGPWFPMASREVTVILLEPALHAVLLSIEPLRAANRFGIWSF